MNARAWRTASWPTVASTAMSTSFGFTAARTRAASRIMSASTCNRPAVSTISTSWPSRRACFRAFLATLTASRPSETTGIPISRPSVMSCSTAPGRCRSAAASSGRRPFSLRWSASLAHAVVFPEPWRPAIMTTAGEGSLNGRCSPPRVWTSSSFTTFTTC
jgi:hypothetical protein